VVADVHRLADERVARLGEVDPDLVRLAGLEADLAQRGAAERLARDHVRDRALALVRTRRRAAQAVAAVGHQLRLDPARRDRAVRHAQVHPLHRVRAQLRREGIVDAPDDNEFVIGDVRVNLRTASATRRNRHLELSPHEFELLRYLIAHRGEVVSREQLLRDVWGYSQLSVTRTVDNYVFRLRNHVEPRPHDPRFILTVHGSGYRLVV
jgi:hypothetical protein